MAKTNLTAQYENQQISFDDSFCETDCPIWDRCGGSISAPCKCIKRIYKENTDCRQCLTHCLERKIYDKANHLLDSFLKQIKAGLTLDEVKVKQPLELPQFPILIPTKTYEISKTIQLDLKWVAIDAEYLFNENQIKPVELRPYVESPKFARYRSAVNSDCRLIAVLNGLDWILEGFWGAKSRKEILNSLENSHFYASTGPTFSVHEETPRYLASQNICSLMRHNRVIQEIDQTNLIAIPNLYWRNDAYIEQWIDWINSQKYIKLISRDFSMTDHPTPFMEEFNGLLKILKAIKKQLHVFVIGVSVMKSRIVLEKLSSLGHTCSFITSDPIIQALKGAKQLIVDNGEPKWVRGSKKTSREEMIVENFIELENFLIDQACQFSSYNEDFLKNIRSIRLKESN